MGATDAPLRPIARTEQRWFVGAHANVGGGYFSDPLAQIPFKWLKQKATTLGLTFKDEFAMETGAATAAIADSYAAFLKGWYRPMRLGLRYYRPIDVPPPEEGKDVKIINETIDSSVFARWRAETSYRPPGLASWAKAKAVDLVQIQNSVGADDPRVAVAD